LAWLADAESAQGHLATALENRRRQIDLLQRQTSQNTDVEYTGFLEPIPDINTSVASFSLSNLARSGPANASIPGFVIQNFAGGTFNLYDPSNSLLLSGLLTTSSLQGTTGPPGTGAVFTTNIASVTGGSLAAFIVPTSLALSMNLTNVNGGAGFSVGDGVLLNPFVADSVVNISGDPTPLGGAIIRTAWLRYYEPGDRPERFIQTVQSWDTANKATELSDYSVCTTWGVYENRYYLLDVFRQRLNYPDLKRKLRELAWRDRPNKILIEDKASGTQVIQDLKADGVHAVTAYQPPTGTDKIMRLHAQTALFENGRVLLPSRAPWLADYVTELTSFPGSRYDDQVDSTTQALDHLRLRRPMYISPELLEKSRLPGPRSRFY